MHLMPQLPTPFAELLARQLCGLSVEECRDRRALDHTNRVYTPTGGTRIGDVEYSRLRDALADVGAKAGYPQDTAAGRSRFDVDVAIFLHREFRITENEASKGGVWNFLSCVALPDLVRWRWQSGGETALERFLAGNRNTFERLWWRAHAYFDPANERDQYWLLREIGEDESVGMMERTLLSGMRPFVVAVLKGLLESYKAKPPIARSELMRDAMKRFRRLAAVVALETLSESELTELCRTVFAECIGRLKLPHDAKPPDNGKSMAAKPVALGSKTIKSPLGGAVSSEDLAWLEAEMKRNQGQGGKR